MERRELRFETLAEAVADAESLAATGYEKAGKWDLSQVLGHLSEWMSFPIDGFPRVPLVMRPVVWMIRKTAAPGALRRALEDGTMRPGTPTVPTTVPTADGDEAEAVSQFRDAAARLEAHAGPWHPSPVFGSLDAEQHRKLQLTHCAHHLSFLRPKAG